MTSNYIFAFSESEFTIYDYSRFLDQFHPRHLPRGVVLQPFFGTIGIAFEGFENNPNAVLQFGEFQNFLARLDLLWPHALYFLDLQRPDLFSMILGAATLSQGRHATAKAIDPGEYSSLFIGTRLPLMQSLGRVAKLQSYQLEDRLVRILRYTLFQERSSVAENSR